MKLNLSEPENLSDVISEPVYFPSHDGLKIAGFVDHRAQGFDGCPFVIMSPKYGETKKNNLQLAYKLAANGMNVLRFDHTCHVGESGGEKGIFTLERGTRDIISALDFLNSEYQVKTASLLANSLSARSAIRAAAQDERVNLLVCLVGVVNLAGTLSAVYREDVVGGFLKGKRWGFTDSFFGHAANWDVFLENACEQDFHTLEGTLVDVATIRAPTVFFCGGNDPWVDLADVKRLVDDAPNAELVVLKEAKHEIRENAVASKKAFEGVVARVVKEAWGLDSLPETLRNPDRKAMFTQNRIERERLRASTKADHTEDEFWTHYLGKYVLLEHVKDYGEYLDLVCDLGGMNAAGGGIILDAGCGNGMLGASLMRKFARQRPGETPPLYVGLDLTRAGLADSLDRHVSIEREQFHGRDGKITSSPGLGYSRVDFDELGEQEGHGGKLRFADATFDVVFCSLVLSYLKRPEILMRELRRVLRPGCPCIISSMKPHCDVSVIYKEFVDTRETESEIVSARNLLSGVGQIRQKEDLGFYTFFSGDDLSKLACDAGFRDPQVFQSFGGQAVVVRALA